MCEGCRAGPSPKMDRRNFLRLSGAGLAGAVLFGTAGDRVLAQSGSSLGEEFSSAASEYDVPRELLLAAGYVNTLWEMPPPTSSPYDPEDVHGHGGYGVMQLSEVPSRDTLGTAASITGLSQDKLKEERAANVRGGAAVLADLSGGAPSGLADWYGAVAEYGGGPLYANDVYDVLRAGASATTSAGEQLVLRSRGDMGAARVVASKGTGEAPRSTWYGNHGGNRTNANRGAAQIDRIVIHVAQGSYSGTLNWFNDSRNQSSAHYTVSAKGGDVGQSVKEEDIAWHAGWWATNKTSIGIEHEGYIGNPSYFEDAMYEPSARLTAYLCKKYKIPVKRRYIIGHDEAPGCPGGGGGVSCHQDPGQHWEWGRYMDLVKRFRR